ncbi:MAG TPA: HupE/UreJ family protein [Hyphomicrobiaceae bacterium]|nr:HupE/UreJ family protein [Hyphomicrobiaceae bacterium]
MGDTMAISSPHVARVAGWALLALCATTMPALAHHAMGGEVPQTFMQGLLSGLGHPVIGIDHFAFIVAVGVAAALAGQLWTLTPVFAIGAFSGCLIHLGGVTLPMAELVIAASVLLLGAIIASNRDVSPFALGILFAGAGLFHGWAYGESIFGAEPTPLIAYLAGFTLIQLVIAISAGFASRWMIESDGKTRTNVRLAGAVVAGIGLALFVGHIEGLLFPNVQ